MVQVWIGFTFRIAVRGVRGNSAGDAVVLQVDLDDSKMARFQCAIPRPAPSSALSDENATTQVHTSRPIASQRHVHVHGYSMASYLCSAQSARHRDGVLLWEALPRCEL